MANSFCEVRLGNGRLLRSWKDGEAKLNGYLEDYAYLIEGLLESHQTTFDSCWFMAAQELAETMLRHFAGLEGTLCVTSDDHETLITRPRDLQDNATPSVNAMALRKGMHSCDFKLSTLRGLHRKER